MKIIKQQAIMEYWDSEDKALKRIEAAGRICYKSEGRITEDSAPNFVAGIIRSGHLSVVEHVNITVRFITNRGVTHELVRHRLCSFSQESTRYCDYGSGDVIFIEPVWWDKSTEEQRQNFISTLKFTEVGYKILLHQGWKPQQAREVLPNALKTEIMVTANVREWIHIFELRCSKAAHPQIRALMLDLLNKFRTEMPFLFGAQGARLAEE